MLVYRFLPKEVTNKSINTRFRIWYHEYKSSSFDKMLHIYNLIYTFTSQSKNGIWDWKITKMNWCSKTGVNWFEQSCLCVTIINFHYSTILLQFCLPLWPLFFVFCPSNTFVKSRTVVWFVVAIMSRCLVKGAFVKQADLKVIRNYDALIT